MQISHNYYKSMKTLLFIILRYKVTVGFTYDYFQIAFAKYTKSNRTFYKYLR